MSSITDERFREVFNIVERHIESRYGIPIVITDVPHPFTGDLDGAEIQVDYDLEIDEAVFIMAQSVRSHGAVEFEHRIARNRTARAFRIRAMSCWLNCVSTNTKRVDTACRCSTMLTSPTWINGCRISPLAISRIWIISIAPGRSFPFAVFGGQTVHSCSRCRFPSFGRKLGGRVGAGSSCNGPL